MVKTRLRCAGASDPGRVRKNNEDRFHLDAERGFFMVVDGLGGEAAGEKAAEIAVDRIRARLERLTGTAEQRLREAITMANNEVYRAARSNPGWEGMACVLTVVVLDDSWAVVGHVGDSRLYKIRRGRIDKVTPDHSPVGEREDSGELGEDEAMRHPRRNEVFRDVGSGEHAPDDADFIDILRIPFQSDCALLLCSDGLTDQVTSQKIRRAVESHATDPEAAIHELIDAANEAGGKDNVTVAIVEGEQFAPPVVEEVKAPARIWASRPALFLYGMLLVAAVGWWSRESWRPPPVVIRPRVLTVGPGERFATIQSALAEARRGDTVEVESGEYREQVRLKSGVAVRSRVPRGVVLRADPLGDSPGVLADDVTGATLSGFRILADAQMPLSAGIVLINSQVEMDDLEVAGAGTGIETHGARSSVLRASAIHDCTADGILVSGTSAPWLSHNAIQRNGHAGVAVLEGSHPVLVGNVIEKNPVALPPDVNMDTIRERNFFLDAKPPRGGRKK
ncbi:MAG TPA: protein phosphatase 2C domain-containing protein [Bryobacteraceae bacterium]|nr:protein phosphatase 2C domain-containing protein [Bryobacteraceae bacterium]HUI80973.1 protein phosphatase 2C domain-containing protein [Bryobacteraceae bacterium]